MTRPEIAVCFDAIVTDMGGILCHVAILAREKNVPCIVGAGNATALLSTGMELCVDGDGAVCRRRNWLRSFRVNLIIG